MRKSVSGCIHIYCGEGKGKTTAATGLAVRGAGRGMKVLIARFLKYDNSGEVSALSQMEGITVLPCLKNYGFYFQMTEDQKREATEYFGQMFDKAWKEATDQGYDMVILDEIVAACNYGLVSEDWLIFCLRERPESLEVVMTGRNPSQRLLETADYVSEIQNRKHPFDRGVKARIGIEY